MLFWFDISIVTALLLWLVYLWFQTTFNFCRDYSTACSNCSSFTCKRQKTFDTYNPDHDPYTYYCGNCGKYREGHKHKGVYR